VNVDLRKSINQLIYTATL